MPTKLVPIITSEMQMFDVRLHADQESRIFQGFALTYLYSRCNIFAFINSYCMYVQNHRSMILRKINCLEYKMMWK